MVHQNLDNVGWAREKVYKVLEPFKQLTRVRCPLLGAIHVNIRTSLVYGDLPNLTLDHEHLAEHKAEWESPLKGV
jgi:hypothetical protein